MEANGDLSALGRFLQEQERTARSGSGSGPAAAAEAAGTAGAASEGESATEARGAGACRRAAGAAAASASDPDADGLTLFHLTQLAVSSSVTSSFATSRQSCAFIIFFWRVSFEIWNLKSCLNNVGHRRHYLASVRSC